MTNKVKEIKASEILDSRGNPTIETTIILESGESASSSIPSGASTSSYEAFELRDEDPNRYQGKGVLKACEIVNNQISKALVGRDPTDQFTIDKEMIALDKTPNKKNLGGNSILSVSQALVKIGAVSQKLKLWEYLKLLCNLIGLPRLTPTNSTSMPTPTFNIINGGEHGAGNLDFQEYHVVPAISKPYHEALEIGQNIYEKLKEILINRNTIHAVGDEGGFAPNLATNRDALDLVVAAVEKTSYIQGKDVFLGIDLASSHFFKDGKYSIKDRSESLTPELMISYLKELSESYPLLFLEDALSQDSWEDWSKLTAEISDSVMIVGDDLIATNPERLKKAIKMKAANAILVKPNQIGTITETLGVCKEARLSNWKLVVSHRSGETNDTFIADLAVGLGAEFVKFGAPARGERVAKYNRLLEIEKELEIKH